MRYLSLQLMFMFGRRGFAGLVLFGLAANSVLAQDTYSPYVDQTYPANLYWGDTHLHTNLSLDAYLFGNTRFGREDAYKFARGDVVLAANGEKIRIGRPLDFLLIADHAENLGVMTELKNKNPTLLTTTKAKIWSDKLSQLESLTHAEDATSMAYQMGVDGIGAGNIGNQAFRTMIWQQATASADQNNIPGLFTAFIGYEWTMGVGGHRHRVVLFKDDAKKANHIVPFSSFDSEKPEDLWAFLQAYQDSTDGEVLAIPHNSNLSKGLMFALTDSEQHSFTQHYAKSRAQWEPLVEVTQTKGDSETHPVLSPDDEFADYETLTRTDNPADRPYEYARSALGLGLQEQSRIGVNPFKFGMIGSSDAHNANSGVEENNFVAMKTHPQRAMRAKFSASGYTGIWATENTREALFAAMKRKEVYATTGPRISLRFFGGWDFEPQDSASPNLALIGYQKGVPMGGDLSNTPMNKSPRFLIRAVKDPAGANLDRLQVIKGWQDKKGKLHEKVYDVALADEREINRLGAVKPVGSTVDASTASYTNTIGDPELAAVWTDPDFSQDESAFYYLRVLEIPTPRWTAYDAKYFGIDNLPEEIPTITQERAYSSPIWFTPRKVASIE